MEHDNIRQPLNFLASEYKLNLGCMMPIKLSLAFNNTLVFVHKPNQYELVHMTLTGHILLQRRTLQSTAEFVMPDERTIIFEETDKTKHILKALNLQNNKTTVFEYTFLSELNFKIFQFKASKLICIVERLNSETKLGYYSLTR